MYVGKMASHDYLILQNKMSGWGNATKYTKAKSLHLPEAVLTEVDVGVSLSLSLFLAVLTEFVTEGPEILATPPSICPFRLACSPSTARSWRHPQTPGTLGP